MGKLATCRAVSNTYPYNDPQSIFQKHNFHPPTETNIDLKYNHTVKQPEQNIK